MRGRQWIAAGLVLGAALAGLGQAANEADAEDPGPRGSIPKLGKWKGSARTVDGRSYALQFRVVKRNGRYEVRDLVTKGSTTCAEDDGSTSRQVSELTLSRALVRTQGALRGVWSVTKKDGSDVQGTFRPSTRMTGSFQAMPPAENCNGTTVFFRARLAVPAR